MRTLCWRIVFVLAMAVLAGEIGFMYAVVFK